MLLDECPGVVPQEVWSSYCLNLAHSTTELEKKPEFAGGTDAWPSQLKVLMHPPSLSPPPFCT